MDPITLPGTMDSLEPIAAYVRSAAASAGLEERAIYKLRLAVDEIATNIITHGYLEAGQEGQIALQAAIDASALTVILEDGGAVYDPQQALDQDRLGMAQPAQSRPVGGLGVFLAIHSVDRFIYERADGRNRNVFVVFRPSSHSGS